MGPGLLFAVTLALCFGSLADTGGTASASLHISAPAGGASGVACCPFPGPIPPRIYVSQEVDLIRDIDGDGLLDPGDIVAYSALVRSLSPEPLRGAHFVVLFSPLLEPIVEPGWHPSDIGGFRVLETSLPVIPPGGKARVGFVVRLAGPSAATAVFFQGVAYGDGYAVYADDPGTRIVLDPVGVAVRQVAGGAAGFLPSIVFTKRALVEGGSHGTRLAAPGDTIAFSIRCSALGKLDLWDLLPPGLALIPESLEPSRAEVHVLGGLTFIHATYSDKGAMETANLRYKAKVNGHPSSFFIASRAMAVLQGGEIIFSDDPDTPSPWDPTAILFPWGSEEWSPEPWEDGKCLVPVLVRDGAGERLRWAMCGPTGSTGDTELSIRLIQLPLRDIPRGGLLGLLRSQIPAQGKVYVPEMNGVPVFVPLDEAVSFIEGLRGPYCDYIYLPVLVELQGRSQVELTGVITNEGL